VSRHLSVLKEAGLVDAEREGQFIRYRLNTTVYQEVIRYLMKVLRKGAADA
jgi:DNA-binding transcriptional ArsR family regulator